MNKAVKTGTIYPIVLLLFPKQRKEPITDASHVKNVLARFNKLEDVSDKDRYQAFANIKKAAEHYGIEVHKTNWHSLGKNPHTKTPSNDESEMIEEGKTTLFIFGFYLEGRPDY